MTRNQIEYLKHLETMRNNQAQLIELNRSNLERERQGQASLDETAKHNRATEEVATKQLIELGRHNLATEQEASTHNRNVEAETAAHNRETERQGVLQLAETQRSNLARESETARSNQARERLTEQANRETARANREREALGWGQLSETERANRAKEQLGIDQLMEQARMNDATIAYNSRRQDEVERQNLANNVIDTANQVTRAGELAERVRSDLASEAERARHNLAQEAIWATKNFATNVNLTQSPVITSTGGTASVTQPKQPQLPSGGNNISLQPNSPAVINPSDSHLVNREVSDVYEGFAREISGALTGNKVQIAKERFSNGAVKYFQEEIRNGKVISRKQISSQEYQRLSRPAS